MARIQNTAIKERFTARLLFSGWLPADDFLLINMIEDDISSTTGDKIPEARLVLLQ